MPHGIRPQETVHTCRFLPDVGSTGATVFAGGVVTRAVRVTARDGATVEARTPLGGLDRDGACDGLFRSRVRWGSETPAFSSADGAEIGVVRIRAGGATGDVEIVSVNVGFDRAGNLYALWHPRVLRVFETPVASADAVGTTMGEIGGHGDNRRFRRARA